MRENTCKKYIGNHYFTKDGKKEFVVVKCDKFSKAEIEFIESGYRKTVSMGNVLCGNIQNPFKNSCIVFEDPSKAIIGHIFKTNGGDLIKIIEYKNYNNVVYQFMDEYEYIGSTTMQNIRKGQVRNPYKRDSIGAYIGVCDYAGKEYKWLYSKWQNMVYRGTGAKSKYKYSSTNGYIDNYVDNGGICDEWMCYANFANWYMDRFSKMNQTFDYAINKDLLYILYCDSTNGYRFYSPETVEIIPFELHDIIVRYNKDYKLPDELMKKVSCLADSYYYNNGLSDVAYAAIKSFYCYEPNKLDNIQVKTDKSDILKNHI